MIWLFGKFTNKQNHESANLFIHYKK